MIPPLVDYKSFMDFLLILNGARINEYSRGPDPFDDVRNYIFAFILLALLVQGFLKVASVVQNSCTFFNKQPDAVEEKESAVALRFN